MKNALFWRKAGENMKIIEKDELKTLVPHRGKMFLVDRITDYDTEKWEISSETKITEDFMFFDKKLDAVPNYALFEIAAQTVSALTGLYARENNLPPNMGMILSVSRLKFDSGTVKSGQTVTVKAFRESDVGKVSSFGAFFYVDGSPYGEGKFTVMESIGQ